MAKIDTTRIEKFDSMTPEEKISALLEFEIEDPKPTDESAEMKQLRNNYNKVSSECAEYRKALRQKQTEAERAEADRMENEKKLQEELQNYRNKERISTYKAQFMAAGFDADTAATMANNLPEGVTDDFFATTKQFLEAQKQTLLSEALNKQPKPSVGTPPTANDAEQAEIANLRRYIGLK